MSVEMRALSAVRVTGSHGKSRCPATTVGLATATTETVAVVAVAKETGCVWLSQPARMPSLDKRVHGIDG